MLALEGDALNDPPTPHRPPRPDLSKPLRKRRRGVQILPSLFTLGNLLSGFASIHYTTKAMALQPGGLVDRLFGSHFALAGYCIFLAMVFDMFDGFVARLTRSASDFGAELDSLADMVSFGIAPAFLSIQLIGFLLVPSPSETQPYFAALPGPFSDNTWLRLFWVIAGGYVCC